LDFLQTRLYFPEIDKDQELTISLPSRYDLFAINIASTMLGLVYTDRHTQLSRHQDLGIKVAALCGTLIGQLFFGWLADIGRHIFIARCRKLPDHYI
jgi:hypothetical protein